MYCKATRNNKDTVNDIGTNILSDEQDVKLYYGVVCNTGKCFCIC